MTSAEQREQAIFLAFMGGYTVHELNNALKLSVGEAEAIIRRELWGKKAKAK